MSERSSVVIINLIQTVIYIITTEHFSDIGLRLKHCFVDNKLKNKIYN